MKFSQWQFDLLVDPSLPADNPSANKFQNLQSAVEACSNGTPDHPTVIGIMPGVYLLNGTETSPGLIIERDYIKLLGLSSDAKDIVLADNRGEFQGSQKQRSMSVEVRGTGFEAENVSFYNYCNEPLVYPRDPSLNRPARSDSETQAYVLGVSGGPGKPSDRLYFKNCRFVSWLDTLAVGAERAYFKDCYIQGTDDFMGASGVFLYEDCVIGCYSGYPIYGAGRKSSGMVLLRCKFISLQKKSKHTQIPLNMSKEPGYLAVISCTFPDNARLGWCKKLPLSKDFYYYNLRFENGSPAEIPGSEVCACALTSEQVKGFNPWNLLRGNDDWNPDNCREKYADFGDIPVRVAIVQDEVEQVIDTLNEKVSPLELTSWKLAVQSVRESSWNFLRTGRGSASFHVQVFPERPSSKASLSVCGPAELQKESPEKFSVTGCNDGTKSETAIVTASASNGISASVPFEVAPALLPPPIIQGLSLSADGGSFRLTYQSEGAENCEDTSEIVWYRTNQDGSEGIPLAASNGTGPRKIYTPSNGDIGSFLTAVIVPRSSRSSFGVPVSVTSPEPIKEGQVQQGAFESDFSEIVCLDASGEQKEIPSGCWNITGKWLYGIGYDGAAEIGLLTNSQFCRLDYRQDGDFGDMSLQLSLDPEKRAGQGFGGPGQFQEVYIKYDPVSRSGYGVRYTRVPEDARSVQFQLFSYEKDSAVPISDAKLSRAFRTGCQIQIEVKGDIILFSAASDADGEHASVSLSAPITPNRFGGFGLFHTGTVARGNRTSLRHIQVKFKKLP